MAELKVTHIGKFFQEFSHPIPRLKELRIWRSALRKRTHQIIKVILMAWDERFARKRLDYDQRWGMPPNKPCLFLAIS